MSPSERRIVGAELSCDQYIQLMPKASLVMSAQSRSETIKCHRITNLNRQIISDPRCHLAIRTTSHNSSG